METASSEPVAEPTITGRSPPRTRVDRPLVRTVARLPWKVRTKLLVAFVGIVVLFAFVGILGLRALGQSDARVKALGTLQLRASTYRELETASAQIRQLLALRAGGAGWNRYLGRSSTFEPARQSLALLDQTITATLSQLGPATDASRFGFVPSAEDARALTRVRRDHRRLSGVMRRITAFDEAGAPGKSRRLQHAVAEPLANELALVTGELSSTTRAETKALIAQNRGAYASSRNLVIGAGIASIFLALLLGWVLSSSVVGPIQRTDDRLAEIAAGDFSRHVDVPNRDELGALAANLNRMNDELRDVYEQLETVSRHKSEFLANMSHELRTPLNAIIGFSEVLQQQLFGELNEQQLGYVDDVLEAGRHLLSLINDILDLSKVEAGRMELELSEISLPDTLRSGLTMSGERAARDGIALGLSVEPEHIVIEADERKVRQVVFNLLSNAVKFTPRGGRVDVTAHLADGAVEVAVADTGPGIAEEDRELIFTEFGQGRVPGSRYEGTGFGLPLARRFVELHGGRLWVESTAGGGSTFRFTLPLTQSR